MKEPAPACAPVALFVYNRPEHTRRTLESLSANRLAEQTVLHVYADGPKPGEGPQAVEAVRRVVGERPWCGEVRLVAAPANRGLAASIVAGVSERLAENERLIVLEDDLELSPGFLEFMNRGLELYADAPEVMQIAGYLPELETELPPTFFSPLTTSWGWATWRRAWAHFQPGAAGLEAELARSGRGEEFNLEGAYDFRTQLRLNAAGRLQTWAVLWYASVFLRRGLVLYPGEPLARNLGHDGSGTHGQADGRYGTGRLSEGVAVEPRPQEVHAGAREAMRRRYQAPPPPRWKRLRSLFRRGRP